MDVSAMKLYKAINALDHEIELIEKTLEYLSDDLLKPKYRKIKTDQNITNPVWGHCYVVSEALYHSLGGKEEGWTVYRMNVDGINHWWIENKYRKALIDGTSSQFDFELSYGTGKRSAFLTNTPSLRARALLDRMTKK